MPDSPLRRVVEKGRLSGRCFHCVEREPARKRWAPPGEHSWSDRWSSARAEQWLPSDRFRHRRSRGPSPSRTGRADCSSRTTTKRCWGTAPACGIGEIRATSRQLDGRRRWHRWRPCEVIVWWRCCCRCRSKPSRRCTWLPTEGSDLYRWIAARSARPPPPNGRTWSTRSRQPDHGESFRVECLARNLPYRRSLHSNLSPYRAWQVQLPILLLHLFKILL